MARSRSSGGGGGGVCSWLAAVLALWSMVSVVVIVVWATWAPRAGAGRCEARRRALQENTEGARVVWERERQTSERERALSTDTQTRLQREIHSITHTITHTNQMLTHHLHTQAVLRENLTALQNEVQQYEHAVAKLTTEHTHCTELIEELQVNLSRERHQLDSCSSLCDAARSRYAAVEMRSVNSECDAQLKKPSKTFCFDHFPCAIPSICLSVIFSSSLHYCGLLSFETQYNQFNM
ncbi:hypothetical protein PHYPO_G00197560 [Pangasianodon hypophthalmus]|uniref:Uncharacterized protein n=1 Tax=Pangasianodon hypophthalmus TaxID=310915 RepID=A0A5N5PKJ1_PANHP|nr:uncharacterized protein LOC113540476 isoform X2 [Pangasianodon hypophthalmus]KAB5579663.1 hypothetical protein PHYPO_G00197560 [Pangasianodon hypophthalmus]